MVKYEKYLIIDLWQPRRHDTSCAKAVKAVSGEEILEAVTEEETSI